jgi:putative ABC transport system permease protein
VAGVTVVSGVRAANAKAFGSTLNLTGVEPQVTRVIFSNWQAGDPQTPSRLGMAGAFVTKSYGSNRHLHVGSPISLQTPSGTMLHQTVLGITNPPQGATSPYGDVAISAARFDSAYQNPQNLYTFVNTQGGVTPANTRTLTAALGGFPDAKL